MELSRRSLVLTFTAMAGTAKPALEKQDLWMSGQGGYAIYRIPGMAVTAKGSILAWCEARKTGRGDWGPIDLMLRRSNDGGRTFSPPVQVGQLPGPHKKNPMALAQKLADPDAVTYNNPVGIAGRDGAVHFLYCLEYMRAFYTRSGDDGQTWSAPVEITGAFEEFRKGYPWRVLAVGPGHGLQLKSGRLLAPVWLSTGTGGHAHRPSVAATIYSDDRGRTWRAGAIAIGDTPEWVNPGETTAVELSGGRVMLNVRSESKQNRRLVTVSKDGISGWSSPRFQEELPEPICFGSIARVSGNILVFSNPGNLTKTNGEAEPGKPRDRRNLTIHLSEDEGKSWKRKRVLDQGWAGYSDLVVRPNGELLCLYERGRSEALTLARFNLDWVRKPAS